DAPSSAREPLWDVLGMHISGFADTSARPELAGLRAGLLDIEHEWQRHQLGLLLGASGARYEPAFRARATETILSRTTLGLDLPQFGVRASRDSAMGPEAVRRLHEQQYPGLVERYSLYRDVDLANPEVAALRALGQNPVAAFDFVTNPDGSVHQDNLTVLLQPFGVTRLRELSFANALGESDSHPSVRELIARSERYSADVVRTVLTTDEALTGASQEQRVALLDAAIEQVGSGDASIAAKRAVTGSMHPYLD